MVGFALLSWRCRQRLIPGALNPTFDHPTKEFVKRLVLYCLKRIVPLPFSSLVDEFASSDRNCHRPAVLEIAIALSKWWGFCYPFSRDVDDAGDVPVEKNGEGVAGDEAIAEQQILLALQNIEPLPKLSEQDFDSPSSVSKLELIDVGFGRTGDELAQPTPTLLLQHH